MQPTFREGSRSALPLATALRDQSKTSPITEDHSLKNLHAFSGLLLACLSIHLTEEKGHGHLVNCAAGDSPGSYKSYSPLLGAAHTEGRLQSYVMFCQ